MAQIRYIALAGARAGGVKVDPMVTPKYVPPFTFKVSSFFERWCAHPAGLAAIALITRLDNVALAKRASDAGRPALDPLQEEIRAAIPAQYLADRQFKRFLGNFMRRLMEHSGYELVRAGVPLPQGRRIVLRSAATYRPA